VCVCVCVCAVVPLWGQKILTFSQRRSAEDFTVIMIALSMGGVFSFVVVLSFFLFFLCFSLWLRQFHN
jgi:hypothetical protein